MKALVYTRPGDLEFIEVDEPRPAPGEVLVEVAAAGICGSELEGVASRSPFRVPPLVMGHEFAGRRLDTGEAVIINPLVACGDCDQCRRGLPNVCRHRAILGIQRPGGFAERVAAPEHNLYPAPAGLPWQAAALVEPVANAVHGLRRLGAERPRRLGIIGGGTIGLVSLLAASRQGIAEIDVAELAEERQALAARLGATRVAARLEGEYDAVIDAVGATATRAASVDHVRPGGVAVWLGLHGPDPAFDAQAFIRTEKAVVASFCYDPEDFAEAIRLTAQIDPFWVTSIPLSEGAEVFSDLMNGRTDLVKVQLVP